MLRSSFGVAEGAVEVVLYQPEDFHIIFTRADNVERVFCSDFPEGVGFRLIFKRWRRKSIAVAGPLRYWVMVELR